MSNIATIPATALGQFVRMEIPGIGRFAMCQEPTGAEFALFSR